MMNPVIPASDMVGFLGPELLKTFIIQIDITGRLLRFLKY